LKTLGGAVTGDHALVGRLRATGRIRRVPGMTPILKVGRAIRRPTPLNSGMRRLSRRAQPLRERVGAWLSVGIQAMWPLADGLGYGVLGDHAGRLYVHIARAWL
jgi:hypothetical protein